MEQSTTGFISSPWFAAFAIAIGLSVLAPVEAATIIYAIDPARSRLEGSGNVRNITMSPQAPGSLTGQINGWLSAQWHDTGLTFSGGSRIVAMPHPAGPFLPSPQDTGSGSMVDNFGAEGRLLGVRLFSAAVRDAVADIASGAANFDGPVTDLQFGFVDGTVDYHDGFNDEFGFLNLAELLPVQNSSGGNLVRTLESKLDTITVPVFVDFPIEFLEPNDSRLRLEGQFVATSPVLTIEAGTLTSINSTLHLTALIVEPGATVRLTADPLVTQTLRMADDAAAGSTLDLTTVNTAMIVDYLPGPPSPAAEVRQRIIAGRGNTDLIGAWDGKGITSSAAQADPSSLSVGWAVNGEMPLGPYTSFRGQTVDPTSVLIRATRIGDANLDGVVDDDDVTIVGATFGKISGAVWALGDFDYDGDVDDNDVTLVGALYDPSAPPLGSAAGASPAVSIAAVPEPEGWLLMALAGSVATLMGLQRGRRWQR
ncbi:MAG: hypothetical protein WD894_09910 [Pirellulales bacterium]